MTCVYKDPAVGSSEWTPRIWGCLSAEGEERCWTTGPKAPGLSTGLALLVRNFGAPGGQSSVADQGRRTAGGTGVW